MGSLAGAEAIHAHGTVIYDLNPGLAQSILLQVHAMSALSFQG